METVGLAAFPNFDYTVCGPRQWMRFSPRGRIQAWSGHEYRETTLERAEEIGADDRLF